MTTACCLRTTHLNTSTCRCQCRTPGVDEMDWSTDKRSGTARFCILEPAPLHSTLLSPCRTATPLLPGLSRVVPHRVSVLTIAALLYASV